jgi:hypothetical protein
VRVLARPVLSRTLCSLPHVSSPFHLPISGDVVHESVLDFLRETCLPHCRQPRRTPKEIPDLEIAGGDWTALLDVSIVHSSGPSVAGRIDSAVSSRAALKGSKYDRSVAMSGAAAKVAFVVENHGAVGGDVMSSLEELARRGAENTGERVSDLCTRFRDMLAIAIQRGNALLVERVRQITGFADLH